jgi:hypothetical protein
MLILFLVYSDLIPNASAKEIVATDEWQKVNQGDTIPPGLHVKIDFETGEKWVKLLENLDDQNDDFQISNAAMRVISPDGQVKNTPPAKDNKNDRSRQEAIKITQLANAELTAEASAKITSQLLDQSQRKKNMIDSISALNDFEADNTVGETELETMYRTLTSLPREEFQSMGMTLPLDPGFDASVEEKQEFERQLREIWNARQDLLKKMEEEYLADVTDVISERIESIRMYLEDPAREIHNVLLLKKKEQMGNDNDLGLNLGTIIGALHDLEFQLTDLDNAREFHDMGGWPLLVALLTDSVHGFESEMHMLAKVEAHSINATVSNAVSVENGDFISMSQEGLEMLKDYQRVIWEIQGLACWCIGTAVKNVEEFHPWAVEDFASLLDLKRVDGPVNAISILLEKLDNDATQVPQLGISASDSNLRMKQKFEVYALGSLLRGNRDAIYYFDSVSGSSTLLAFYNSLMEMGQKMLTMEAGALKILEKLVLLVGDIIIDVQLNPAQNIESDKVVFANLATHKWCSLPAQIFQHPNTMMKRRMLELILNLYPYCTYDDGFNILAEVEPYMVEDEELHEHFISLQNIY